MQKNTGFRNNRLLSCQCEKASITIILTEELKMDDFTISIYPEDPERSGIFRVHKPIPAPSRADILRTKIKYLTEGIEAMEKMIDEYRRAGKDQILITQLMFLKRRKKALRELQLELEKIQEK